MNGSDLLAEFRQTRSETAFAGLVRTYANLVYSVALRRLSNASHAEEAAQLVFIQLAKNPPNIASEAQLAAWLHRTTVYVAIDLWRKETRRRAREEQAVTMQTDPAESTAWHELAPALDEALNDLSDADRHALLLRYFDGQTMRNLGLKLGVSEDAAKMRISRALDRLRQKLTARNVTCTAAILGTLLADHSVQAAPAKLIETLSALKIPAATTGLSAIFAHLTKVKLAVGAAAILIVSSLIFLKSTNKDHPFAQNTRKLNQEISGSTNSTAADLSDTNYMNADGRPDPFKLLQLIFEARKKIKSGRMELSTYFDSSFDANNGETVKLEFDSGRERTEMLTQKTIQYFYDNLTKEEIAEAKEKIAAGTWHEREDGKGFGVFTSLHQVGLYDGAMVMLYEQATPKLNRTTIENPSYSMGATFDPRCLGLRTDLNATFTLEMMTLYYLSARDFIFLGSETVDGRAAWHFQFEINEDAPVQMWVDTDHPTQILKITTADGSMTMKYGDAGNPLPIEATSGEGKWRVIHSQFNQTIDPATWTLSGLHMNAGAAVIDARREAKGIIGYWNGVGLSDQPMAKAQQSPLPIAEMLNVISNRPASSEAFGCATWFILNTPDGHAVDDSVEIIIAHHLQSANLLGLCQDVASLHHRSTKKLLEAILDFNPDPVIKANACFSLAEMASDWALQNKNQADANEAKRFFERARDEFGDLKNKDQKTFAQLASQQLARLQKLNSSRSAPETKGRDLEGNNIDLADYRGKTVLVVFWEGPGVDWKTLREVASRQKGKPFIIVGILAGYQSEWARKTVEKENVEWPSIIDNTDDSEHSLRKAWNVQRRPHYLIMDARGTIRDNDVLASDLNAAIEDAMK